MGTDTDTDTDTDGDTDTGTNPFSECDNEFTWLDETSGLCWQEPPPEDDMTYEEAVDYCAGLAPGWRLPLIQELFTLIQGCGSSECGVHDPDCLSDTCANGADCESCGFLDGPGPGGCYWDDVLGLDCGGHYWSSSEPEENQQVVWNIIYSAASVGFNDKLFNYAVRCVNSEL